jgi:hypothetical protein
MIMTEKRAKELSLEVWRYLAEHPTIARKDDLPKKLWKKIRVLESSCPLCELFEYDCRSAAMAKCPLLLAKECCFKIDSLWEKWRGSCFSDTETRREAAAGIIKIIEGWEV